MHDGSQRSYHQRSHARGWGGSVARKVGRVWLRESDLVLWPKNKEDMTFILKDQSTAASNGAPRNLHPSRSLWNVGGRSFQGVEVLFCCLSTFICFLFCHSGWGSLRWSSLCTHVYHVYILYVCVYHMMRYVCPPCVAHTFFLANDRQYYVARLPGSDPKMGRRVCGGEGRCEWEVAMVGWGLFGCYR